MTEQGGKFPNLQRRFEEHANQQREALLARAAISEASSIVPDCQRQAISHMRQTASDIASFLRDRGVASQYPQGDVSLPLWVFRVHNQEIRSAVHYRNSNLDYLSTYKITGLALTHSGELHAFSQIDSSPYQVGTRTKLDGIRIAEDADILSTDQYKSPEEVMQAQAEWDTSLEDFAFKVMTGHNFLPQVTYSVSYN